MSGKNIYFGHDTFFSHKNCPKTKTEGHLKAISNKWPKFLSAKKSTALTTHLLWIVVVI